MRAVVEGCPVVAFFGDLFCRGVLLLVDESFKLVCEALRTTGVEFHLFWYRVFLCQQPVTTLLRIVL